MSETEDLVIGAGAGDVSIDFDAVDKLPEGVLALRIKKAVPGKSKSNNLKITLHLQVAEAPDDETLVGRMVWDDLTFTQASAFRIRDAAKGFGVSLPSNFRPTVEAVRELADAFLEAGQEPIWCSVRVDPPASEEYQPQSRVKKYGVKPPE